VLEHFYGLPIQIVSVCIAITTIDITIAFDITTAIAVFVAIDIAISHSIANFHFIHLFAINFI
jgi:hypothetical protein